MGTLWLARLVLSHLVPSAAHPGQLWLSCCTVKGEGREGQLALLVLSHPAGAVSLVNSVRQSSGPWGKTVKTCAPEPEASSPPLTRTRCKSPDQEAVETRPLSGTRSWGEGGERVRAAPGHVVGVESEGTRGGNTQLTSTGSHAGRDG